MIKVRIFVGSEMTDVGLPGKNFTSILKPRVTIQLYKRLSIGLEEYVYFNNRNQENAPLTHTIKTEQKVFLLIYLENSQRRGRYN